MKRLTLALTLTFLLSGIAYAQTRPDLSGAWGPYRGGRGADPKLTAPPATPLALKPDYAKPYEARRAAEAAANSRGEPLANASSSCVPYGVPSMMSVAVYPIEIIQTPSVRAWQLALAKQFHVGADDGDPNSRLPAELLHGRKSV